MFLSETEYANAMRFVTHLLYIFVVLSKDYLLPTNPQLYYDKIIKTLRKEHSFYGRLIFWHYFQNYHVGESHGKGIGVVVDGCPAGIPLTEDDIQPYLDLRKPGQNRYTTKRAGGRLRRDPLRHL